MIEYLLDTNAFFSLVREPTGAVATRGRRTGIAAIGVSAIVVAELAYGSAWQPRNERDQRIAAALGEISVFDLDQPAARRYGEIRAQVRQQGRPIGADDLFIAAHALALNAVLVTRNVRELGRVPGLRVETWEAD